MPIGGIIKKVFGTSHEREIKRLRPRVERINALEPAWEKLTDAELRGKTAEFKQKLENGATLDDILEESFATVREASKRVLGMRHYDVQLIGGMVLHEGKIAEMKTGEGKTLVATLALYLNALLGRGAHLVTVNDYLVRRDAGWNAPMYHLLGMSTGVISGQDQSFVFDPDFVDDTHPDERLRHLRPCSRREAYACDITYATNNELGFDYLRDNMQVSLDACVQRRLWFAIVDEVDSILVDEARTPLIISGQADEPTEKYYTYARLIPRLVAEDDYTLDEKTKSVALTDEGIAKMEQWTGIRNVYDMEHVTEAHHINQALKAHVHFLHDRDYIVVNGEVVIVDEFTGRTMPGRRWSDGLHQAVEAKEGVKVQQENITLATITFQNFFRLYRKLAGMTGTALTEAEEFHKIYKLEVVPVPPNRPNARKDESDLIYKSEEGKFKAVVAEIVERHQKGQPILVGTTSIEKSERLSRLLEKQGVAHDVLNAKQHEREAAIVANAGQRDSVTIATNMAGRGTDILLGEGVADVGGLYIIGTERHESRRIDNQLRGRSGRQGDPGETRFFLSFEDDVMRVFGGERMQGIMDRLRIDDDTPIESRMVTRQIEGAQARVEGHNFDSRRHVVEYDDVMNKQREVIYGERRKILEGTDTRANLVSMVERIVREEVPAFCEGRRNDWDMEALWDRMRQFAPLPPLAEVDLDTLGSEVPEVEQTLIDEMVSSYEEREEKYGVEIMRQVERSLMLQVIDRKWVAYLTQMDHLREGIGLQSYAQVDPLLEYKQQAFGAFQELTDEIQREIVKMLLHVEIQLVQQPPAEPPPATVEEEAPPSGRADTPGGPMSPEDVPAARPAAAAASGRLAAVTGFQSGRPAVRNVIESSAEGERRASGAPAAAAALGGNGNGPAAANGKPRKVGRNDPCWCGSGMKFKRCHGANG
ncbi:MAG TPA: preprotein translocase subunit SecA [Candidatus Dormibacteraeota bacterium]|nr:preprotein translocase subunit SecA [Candidatus Dormibacteraeota bacterium]